MNITPLLVGLAACVLTPLSLCAQSGSATYEIVWESTWSQQTHPVQFPSNPHYAQLIGANHSSAISFWGPGVLATPAIQAMAERGSETRLRAEVSAAMAAGHAEQYHRLGSQNSPRTRTVQVTLSADFPLLTLVAMIAPSPDWFVGIHGMDMMSGGDWIDSAVVPTFAYDSGTDSGSTYTSANQPTVPHVPIARVTTASGPFQGRPGAIGSFTFRRLHGTVVHGCGVNPSGSFGVTGAARLGATLGFEASDPTGQFASPMLAVLAASGVAHPSFPCGSPLPNFGLAGSGAVGELLMQLPFEVLDSKPWVNGGVSFGVTIPNLTGLLGQRIYFQGALASVSRVGLTDGAVVLIGQ